MWVLKWCWGGDWPVLGAKAVPRQLEDLEAKAEEDCVLVSYRTHENPQYQSLQETQVTQALAESGDIFRNGGSEINNKVAKGKCFWASDCLFPLTTCLIHQLFLAYAKVKHRIVELKPEILRFLCSQSTNSGSRYLSKYWEDPHNSNKCCHSLWRETYNLGG